MATHTLANGSNHTSLENVFSDIQNSDTDALIIVHFEAGTHVWNPSDTITLNIPATCTEFHFRGAGEDVTFLQDNWAYMPPFLLRFNSVNAKFRSYDWQMTFGANYPNYTFRNTAIFLSGTTDNFRVHDFKCWPSINIGKIWRLDGWIRGVFDRCDVRLAGSGQLVHADYGGSDAYGDTRWSEATPKGTKDAAFIEDCIYRTAYVSNGIINDTDHGGSCVVRFCDLDSTGAQTHATVALRSRGGRWLEIYCNYFGNTATNGTVGDGKGYCLAFLTNGSMYFWGNTLNPVNGYLYPFIMRGQRRNNVAYGNFSTPNAWGWAGTTGNFLYGTVNTSGTTVTRVTGNPFSGGFFPQQYALQGGALLKINGVQYAMASLTDSTHLELTTSAGTQTGVTFWPVTNWDENTDIYGYPNLDQPGRGQGDLLAGDFPNVYNSTRGNVSTANHEHVEANPRQASQPIRIWNNTHWVSPPGWGNLFISNQTSDIINENRDYFTDHTDGGSAGTGMLGSGNAAAMNATSPTVAGQGFWRTDLGTWNDGSNNLYEGQGQLWVWSGSAWAFDYEPYTYPHPLVTADEGAPPEPTDRKTKVGKIKRTH